MRVLQLLLLGLIPSVAFGQWQSIGNVDSVSSDERGVLLHAGKSVVHVTLLAPDVARVRFAPSGVFARDVSWAVTRTEWPSFEVFTSNSQDEARVSSAEFSVRVRKHPLRVMFFDKRGNIINEDHPRKGMAYSSSEVRVWKNRPPDEQYFGFGEKAGSLERSGTHMTMWNSDIPGYAADTDPLYQSIPFFYGVRSGKAYGIFLDNSYWSSFDMGKESRTQYSFGAEDGELDYYFFCGPTPQKVLARFTDLVGRMPLPPRWALGYQQCRWSYAPEAMVRDIARGFRSRSIPCDVIYLDIDYMEGYRIFTWSKTNFPNPSKMIDDLRAQGFRVAVILDPGIKIDSAYHVYQSGLAQDVFLRHPDGNLFIGKVWPGECVFPDFSKQQTRVWWGKNMSALAAIGVRGWWNDMNEPSVFDVPGKTVDLDVVHDDNGQMTPHAKNHNTYGLLMTRATYEGVRSLLPNERPFVLTRATFAGGQRYSAAWTGDNVASWEHLRMAVPMCLNLGISGQPFVGADIGGFIGYPSGELFARWLQLGVFTPLMRAHSVINEKNKEPWEFGEEFTAINRETINLRYRLLPYVYTTMWQASETGIPAMRPMVFSFPTSGLSRNEDQFMFGDWLLVAPVLAENARTREVQLPEGRWYDYWAERQYAGDRRITVDAPLDHIPLLVKAGAILPSQQVMQYVSQSPIDPLTLTVYPAELTATSNYYEDDGTSFKYQRGQYFLRSMNQWVSSRSITVTLSHAEGSYVPPKRSLVVRIIGLAFRPQTLTVDGTMLRKSDARTADLPMRSWTFDTSSGVLTVRIEDNTREMVIQASE